MGTINADTLNGVAQLSGTYQSSTGGFVHNPYNDWTFDCRELGGQGYLLATGSLSGTLYTGNFGEGTLSAEATLEGTGIAGKVFYGTLIANATLDGLFYSEEAKRHWIGWSKIGDTRLLIDESGEAGYSPLPGDALKWVYNILPFKEKWPIVYSGSGVFKMNPVSTPFPTFGFELLSLQGVYCPGAVAGGFDKHFYINNKKRLCVIGDSQSQLITGGAKAEVKELGYYEFINQLSPNGELIVLHFDKTTDTLYISGVNGGFTLTPYGLGGGYAKLTGVQAGLFASSISLTDTAQHICTDVLDFNYRGIKTLMQIAVSTNLTNNLYVAIDYRFDKTEDFKTSAWFLCNKEGVVMPIVAGIEFRVRVKTLVYENFTIDSIGIRFKYTDKRFNRSFFPSASFIN